MPPIRTHEMSVQSSKPSHAFPSSGCRVSFVVLPASRSIYETTHNGALAFLVPHCNRKRGRKSDLDVSVVAETLAATQQRHELRPDPAVNKGTK